MSADDLDGFAAYMVRHGHPDTNARQGLQLRELLDADPSDMQFLAGLGVIYGELSLVEIMERVAAAGTRPLPTTWDWAREYDETGHCPCCGYDRGEDEDEPEERSQCVHHWGGRPGWCDRCGATLDVNGHVHP